MLDIEEYKLQEKIAINSLTSWREHQSHILQTFEKCGFPTQYKNLTTLRHYINTFHETRFVSYMEECGGITPKDLELLISVILRNLKFQHFCFSNNKQIVPFESALAMLRVFNKIFSLKPDCKKILEIGPGAGFLAQYLYFTDIENYVAIEACESLYLLQAMQFHYLFEDELEQCAFGENCENQILAPKGFCFEPDSDYICDYEIEKKKKKKRFSHIPWWRINKIIENDMQFDIITSNANLTEFSEGALRDYIYLIHKCLSKEGILIICCFGGGATPLANVLKQLEIYQFAALYYKTETVINAFFINKGHSSYQACHQSRLFQDKEGQLVIFLGDISNNVLMQEYQNKMLQDNHRKIYTKEQLLNIIKENY